MAWGNVPTTPAWKDPGLKGKYDPYYQRPQAQQTAYASNPYQDPGFAGAATNADQWGNKLLGQGAAMGTGATGPGGWLSNPAAYNSYFGLKPLDTNNPQTVKDLGSWNQMLMGQQRNAMDEYLGRAAGASANQYARGIGVRGGPDQQGQMFHDAMKTLASGVTGNINQGAGYMKDLYGQLSGTAGQFANAYSNMLNSLLGAGGTQGNLALQNRQALQSGQQNWLQGMSGENAANVNAYNQAMQAAQAAEAQRVAQQRTQQDTADQEMQRKMAFNQQLYAPSNLNPEALAHYRNLAQAYSPWGWAQAPQVQLQGKAMF